MSSWFVSYDPMSGVETRFHTAVDGKFAIETIDHGLQAKIDENKAQFNSAEKKGEYRHIASIPPVVWFDLKRKGIADDPAALRRWLDDSDNRVFKVMDTKLGKRNVGR